MTKRAWVSRLMGVAAGLVAVAAVPAMGAAPMWELLDTAPEHSEFYYDKAGVKRQPEGIVAVTAKVAYGPEGRQEVVDALKNPKYEALSYSLYSYEINCAKSESRLVSVKHANAQGGAIAEFNLTGKSEWEAIPLGSRLDMVVDEECPGKQ